MQQKKNIALLAPFTSYSGYGQYGRCIAQMLILSYGSSENVQLFLIDAVSKNMFKQEMFDLENSKYNGLQKYIKPIQTLNSQFFDVFMMVSVPQAFIQKGLFNIGITALVQVDRVHPQLIQHCNRMDQVWVMSDYNINSLNSSIYNTQDGQQLKLEVPVGKINHAFVPSESKPKTDISKYIDSISQQFLFATVGQWLPGSIGSDRKDIGALISTFIKTFPNNKNVGLLLKVDQGRSSILSEYAIRQKINEIYKGLGLKSTNNNIHFISGNLKESQMREIYEHDKVKAYISFSHGESFGIPIMEFSAITGKPLVIPYHSGLMEYIRPQYSEIMIHKQTQVPRELFNTFMRQFMIPQSKWCTLDYQYASFKMVETVKNYKYIIQRAKQQQKHIQDNFGVNKIAMDLKKILDQKLKDQEDDY